MGLLQQNLKRFTNEYMAAGGFITGEAMLKWFNGKGTMVQTDLDKMSFTRMSAVVMVGVSGSGKTHFAREFVKTHPGFVLCSHDECYGKAMADLKIVNDDIVDARMNEYLDKMLKTAKKNRQHVILDGLFISPVVRAAVINTLRTYGYQIHVVYITIETLANNATEYFFKRAVEFQIYREYCMKHKGTLSPQRMIAIKNDVVKLYCEEKGMTVEELYEIFANDPVTLMEMENNMNTAIKEIEEQQVKDQADTGAFMLGADYYYEL